MSLHRTKDAKGQVKSDRVWSSDFPTMDFAKSLEQLQRTLSVIKRQFEFLGALRPELWLRQYQCLIDRQRAPDVSR